MPLNYFRGITIFDFLHYSLHLLRKQDVPIVSVSQTKHSAQPSHRHNGYDKLTN